MSATGDTTDSTLAAYALGRRLTANQVRRGQLAVKYDTAGTGRYELGAAGAIGPRFTKGPVTGALAMGGSMTVSYREDAVDVRSLTPGAILSAEYLVFPWLTLRGGASWAVEASMGEDEVDGYWQYSSTNAPEPSFGVGITKDRFGLDAALNPGWLAGGPFLLSGASSPMFVMVNLQFALTPA